MADTLSTTSTTIFDLIGEQMILPTGDVFTVWEVRRDVLGWVAEGLDDNGVPRSTTLPTPLDVTVLA